MARVNWGIDADTIDEYDRDSQYAPYTGPVPPNAVYKVRIKFAKYVAAIKNKNPQIRLGLELVPRNRDEKRFKGYFLMKFIIISNNPKAAFTFVPFMDAIGVDGSEFTKKTHVDDDGNITKIGSWRNDGETEILAQLTDGVNENGDSRKEWSWLGALTSDSESDEESDEDDEEEYEFDDEDETDDDEF